MSIAFSTVRMMQGTMPPVMCAKHVGSSNIWYLDFLFANSLNQSSSFLLLLRHNLLLLHQVLLQVLYLGTCLHNAVQPSQQKISHYKTDYTSAIPFDFPVPFVVERTWAIFSTPLTRRSFAHCRFSLFRARRVLYSEISSRYDLGVV